MQQEMHSRELGKKKNLSKFELDTIGEEITEGRKEVMQSDEWERKISLANVKQN